MGRMLGNVQTTVAGWAPFGIVMLGLFSGQVDPDQVSLGNILTLLGVGVVGTAAKDAKTGSAPGI